MSEEPPHEVPPSEADLPADVADARGRAPLLLNAFYLPEEAARAVRRGEAPHVVDEVFRKARALGASLVRIAAYNHAPEKRGDSALRWGPRLTDPVAFRGLDVVLHRAAEHGLGLVLTLGNQWDALGGVAPYVAWAGLPAARSEDPRFFTHATVRELYVEHARSLLQRRNTVDGAHYAEHPALAGIELLNEPRGRGLDAHGHAVRAWVDELARRLRAELPRRVWIATGEEGLDVSLDGRDAAFWTEARGRWLFEPRDLVDPDGEPALSHTTSFRANVRSPFVDVASVHVYPEDWGVPSALVAEAGERFLRESAALAAAHGKRLYVAELGVRSHAPARDGEPVPALPLDERRRIVRRWLDVAGELGAIAAGPWLFAYDARPESWDRYHHRLVDGLVEDAPENGITPALR